MNRSGPVGRVTTVAATTSRVRAWYPCVARLRVAASAAMARKSTATTRATPVPIQRCFRTAANRSEEHTSELQSRVDLVCRLLLEKKKTTDRQRAADSRTQHREPTAAPEPSPSLPRDKTD